MIELWLVGWLVGCLVGWLLGWLVNRLVDFNGYDHWLPSWGLKKLRLFDIKKITEWYKYAPKKRLLGFFFLSQAFVASGP